MLLNLLMVLEENKWLCAKSKPNQVLTLENSGEEEV